MPRPRPGIYDLQTGPPLRRLAGQTLGIVGLGNIGRALAGKAQALGMRVVASGRSRREGMPGVEWRDLDALLAESDYVTLHVPSTPATRHMIGAGQLARMKPTAYLINTARGALVDEAALAEALRAGRLAGAGLDVQQQEPPDLSQPPFNDPRVIVSPHAAFVARGESLPTTCCRARAAGCRPAARAGAGKRNQSGGAGRALTARWPVAFDPLGSD